jgi:hypothetical protein
LLELYNGFVEKFAFNCPQTPPILKERKRKIPSSRLIIVQISQIFVVQ